MLSTWIPQEASLSSPGAEALPPPARGAAPPPALQHPATPRGPLTRPPPRPSVSGDGAGVKIAVVVATGQTFQSTGGGVTAGGAVFLVNPIKGGVVAAMAALTGTRSRKRGASISPLPAAAAPPYLLRCSPSPPAVHTRLSGSRASQALFAQPGLSPSSQDVYLNFKWRGCGSAGSAGSQGPLTTRC